MHQKSLSLWHWLYTKTYHSTMIYKPIVFYVMGMETHKQAVQQHILYKFTAA